MTQTLVRSAEPVVTHNHPKNVRFELNNNNDNRYNNDNDDCGGNNGVGVGLRCSGFEFRDLTSDLTSVLKSNTTTTTMTMSSDKRRR